MQASVTLKHLFEESFARFRDRPAFVSMGVALSYGEVDALSRDFAGYLCNDLGLTPGEAALLEHCAKHLAPYKRPRQVFFRESLPKSPIGKVLRRALRPDSPA